MNNILKTRLCKWFNIHKPGDTDYIDLSFTGKYRYVSKCGRCGECIYARPFITKAKWEVFK